MKSIYLLPTISRPTRITESSCTLIDIVFASNLNNFKSRVFTADIYDHLPISILYDEYSATDEIQPKKISIDL